MEMATSHYLQTHKILYSSVLEKHIGEHVISVTLRLEELGEHTAYLYAETDNDGKRKVRGVIELQEKRYECMLGQGISPYGVLLVMPLDNGSYNNIDLSGTDREA